MVTHETKQTKEEIIKVIESSLAFNGLACYAFWNNKHDKDKMHLIHGHFINKQYFTEISKSKKFRYLHVRENKPEQKSD